MVTATNIITAICLILLTTEVIYVIANTIAKKRPERIVFLRSFKKGKCVTIFLIALPLFFLGYWNSNAGIFESVLSAISHVVDLVVLKFNLNKVSNLLNANVFYKITVYYCCILVIINAALFTLSLIGQRIWQWKKLLDAKFTSKDFLYILGYNENSLAIYKSDRTRNRIIVDKIPADACTTMYINKIGFISCQKFENIIENIFKNIKNKDNKITVIINTENDERNLHLGWFICKKINADKSMQECLFDKLGVYVFGDPRYEAIYDEIVAKSCGIIHYKNKYRMIAMNFIDKYPLTKFMDERHIDYATSLLKPNVDVNVCMIGFGKPNQQIFLTSVANNQFVTSKEGEIVLKQVNYHIFDKSYAEYNKGLNHSYYRFRNECIDAGIAKDSYLPLPELPAHEEYHHRNINDPEFYDEIRRIVTAKKTDANFIIVSFENDLENIDMAQRLVAKGREWGADNLTIFVRVKTAREAQSLFTDKNVFLIGNESECVYNISEITNDGIFQMAQMRNKIYDLEYLKTGNKDLILDETTIHESYNQSDRNWFKKSQLERESSLYCCLSLRSKLNLMGLDYCKENENDLPGLSEDDYLRLYAGDDLPDYYDYEVNNKKVVKYTLDFADSRRKTMAILEHLRWNSFMISKGLIPASKEQILDEMQERDGKTKHTNGKNYALRRHGNLTTFEGLVTFRKMLAERDSDTEDSHDVIKYDYQLLDDAFWLLDRNGYKIVRRGY